MNAVLFTELCVARAQDHTDLPVKMVGSYLVPPFGEELISKLFHVGEKFIDFLFFIHL